MSLVEKEEEGEERRDRIASHRYFLRFSHNRQYSLSCAFMHTYLRFVCCSGLVLIVGVAGVLVSLSSTVSCRFFRIHGTTGLIAGETDYGIWGRPDLRSGNQWAQCLLYPSDQRIDEYADAARSMSVLAPILATLGLLYMLMAKRSNHLNSRLARATVLLYLAAVSQLFTMLVLDSSLCNDNALVVPYENDNGKASFCSRLYGANASIAATALFGASALFALWTMSTQRFAAMTDDEIAHYYNNKNKKTRWTSRRSISTKSLSCDGDSNHNDYGNNNDRSHPGGGYAIEQRINRSREACLTKKPSSWAAICWTMARWVGQAIFCLCCCRCRCVFVGCCRNNEKNNKKKRRKDGNGGKGGEQQEGEFDVEEAVELGNNLLEEGELGFAAAAIQGFSALASDDQNDNSNKNTKQNPKNKKRNRRRGKKESDDEEENNQNDKDNDNDNGGKRSNDRDDDQAGDVDDGLYGEGELQEGLLDEGAIDVELDTGGLEDVAGVAADAAVGLGSGLLSALFSF